MPEIPVRFEGVWKKFLLGEHHDSLRDLVPAMATRLWRRGAARDAKADFWALKDVGFEVLPGCGLGIIGANGAGKSTVLKLLSRILKPTKGCCSVHGRVGALIEVAAGFHPDLTGRENVFLQGAIMGMKRGEIASRFEEIVEFAGVADFIDTPVKRYSSGMNARLGFSIAAHLDPDVLLIDEVLSVGDMAFQLRCVKRMSEFKRQGVAIVFVSHNLQAVAGLCDQALLLQNSIITIGEPMRVIETYVNGTDRQRAADPSAAVQIVSADLLDCHGRQVGITTPGAQLTLRVSYEIRKPVGAMTFGLLLHRSTDGLVVYDGSFRASEIGLDFVSEGDSFTVDFVFRANLTRGQYHFDTHVLHDATHQSLSRHCPAAILSVHETRTCGGVADLEVSPALAARRDEQTLARC